MIEDVTNEKIQAVVHIAELYGDAKTCDVFNIKEDTVRRYRNEAKKRGLMRSDSAIIQKIANKYTREELNAIARGGRIIPGSGKVPIINFEGERIRVGCISDTHIGHKRFSEDRLYQAFDAFKKEGVDFITHSGDVTEGMSNRAGHIYELDYLGYENQKNKAVEVFKQWNDTDIFAIDGNHDRWFIKSNGALIVNDIAKEVNNFHFIGHDEGDISLKGKATLKLWHGEDGNSYALSYRLQKLVESLTGGEKPNAILAGHTHKFVNIFERHIHTTSVPSIQAQTRWMRSKRLAAHVGFCIVDYWVNDGGICKQTVTFYPFYS